MRRYAGNAAEQAVNRELRALGYFTASRRHFGGAGDLIALPAFLDPRGKYDRQLGVVGLLIEVKGRINVWEGFRREDRDAMRECAATWGLIPLLAWRPPGLGGTMWLPEEDWPK